MAVAFCTDGPAEGIEFTVARLPLLLRVTRSRKAFDCLDLLDDTPTDDEVVSLYRRRGGVMFMCPAPDGDPLCAGYEHLPLFEFRENESMRETEGWRWFACRIARESKE